MNLTVAAVIDSLNSANKDEGALISSEDIDVLIGLWSEYDPKATGWISIECLVFLLFEMPQPLGLGRHIPISDQSDINVTYRAHRQHNVIESRIYKEEDLTKYPKLFGCDDILVVYDEDHNQRYFYHQNKKILMNDNTWLKIMKDYNVPVYDGAKVHFKDICKRLIKSSSDNQKLDYAIRRKLRSKWDNRYKSVNKQKHVNTLDKVIAGRVITKWMKHKKKVNGSLSPRKNKMEERKASFQDSYELNSERGFNNFVKQVKDMESIAIHEEDSNAQLKIGNTNVYINDNKPAHPTLITKEQPEKTLNDEDCTFGADTLRKEKSDEVNKLFRDEKPSNYEESKERSFKEIEPHPNIKFDKNIKNPSRVAPYPDNSIRGKISFYSSLERKDDIESEQINEMIEEAEEISPKEIYTKRPRKESEDK